MCVDDDDATIFYLHSQHMPYSHVSSLIQAGGMSDDDDDEDRIASQQAQRSKKSNQHIPKEIVGCFIDADDNSVHCMYVITPCRAVRLARGRRRGQGHSRHALQGSRPVCPNTPEQRRVHIVCSLRTVSAQTAIHPRRLGHIAPTAGDSAACQFRSLRETTAVV